jgi:hypothetical protein
MVYGTPHAKVDYNSLHLKIANAEVSYELSTPISKGKEWSGGRSLLWDEHICTCLLIPKQTIGKGRVRKRGREGYRELS